jgi:hypothetical protein
LSVFAAIPRRFQYQRSAGNIFLLVGTIFAYVICGPHIPLSLSPCIFTKKETTENTGKSFTACIEVQNHSSPAIVSDETMAVINEEAWYPLWQPSRCHQQASLQLMLLFASGTSDGDLDATIINYNYGDN